MASVCAWACTPCSSRTARGGWSSTTERRWRHRSWRESRANARYRRATTDCSRGSPKPKHCCVSHSARPLPRSHLGHRSPAGSLRCAGLPPTPACSRPAVESLLPSRPSRRRQPGWGRADSHYLWPSRAGGALAITGGRHPSGQPGSDRTGRGAFGASNQAQPSDVTLIVSSSSPLLIVTAILLASTRTNVMVRSASKGVVK
jgi:hypothetical protein